MPKTQNESKEKRKKYVRVRDEIDPALEEAVLSNFHRKRVLLTWDDSAITAMARISMIDFLHNAWSYVQGGRFTVSVSGPAVEDTVQMIFDILEDVCERNSCGVVVKCVVTRYYTEITVRPNALSDGLKIKRFGSANDEGV